MSEEKGSDINGATTNNVLKFDSPDLSSAAGLLQPYINFEEIDLQEKVGHGSYGVVYKALWLKRFVAVKEFEASAEQKAIETEIKQLSRVRHPNIIALFGISSNQQSKYLIMEFAEGGSLHNFLHGKMKPFYSTAHAMSWARQCAEGVAYLHAMKPKPLIHRDLKPLNLLLTNKCRHLKLCDFGTVADKQTWMTNNKGSAAWMAPEVFEGSKYTEKCDIFSWAIVLWEVLSRQQPFKEIDNTYSIMWKIHKGERPPMIKDCPETIQSLMTRCWATIPDLRPSMQHVVTVMNELITSFPGADEPLEYEFGNQKINHRSSCNSESNNSLDFSNSTSRNTTNSTQITPTNPSNNSNTLPSSPPNLFSDDKGMVNFNVPPSEGSIRWDVIPKESDSTAFCSCKINDTSKEFNLTPSAEAAMRYETIRRDITQSAGDHMISLAIDVDSNAWDLRQCESNYNFNLETESFIPDKNILTNKAITDPSLGDDDDESDDADQSLHEILDSELQPEPPIPNNPQSQKIYREHRRLAKEYLRVDTKLYYAQDSREKLMLQIDPTEREEKQELLKKMNEKTELQELYSTLKLQLEKIRAGQGNTNINAPLPRLCYQDGISNANIVSDIADDGWVVVANNQNLNS